ncbi:MAG: hypothetical protein EOP84_20095 [Verrucomicrobiaceae bacterium]|nr:MAG: hypothetical protein EOP84_20095 [Verrucomicrobiaceae bacterium]
MQNLFLFQDGTLACELINSQIHPLPHPSHLTPGTEHAVVIPFHLPPWNSHNFALATFDGSHIPIAIVRCQLGIEGFTTTVRISLSTQTSL